MTLGVLALTALPFVVSPGASFAITVDAVSDGDRRASVKVWLGTTLGIAVIASIFALSGIGQLLTENDAARTIFGLVGGTVLVLLGILSAVKAVRALRSSGNGPRPPRRLVLWSFVALITNIKALSLYALVVPALDADSGAGRSIFFAFAAVHVVMLFIWLTLLGWGIPRLPSIGTSQRVRVALMAVAALTLIVLGLRTLVQALH